MGSPLIDKIMDSELELECPNCGFYNPFTLKQAKLRDVIICRGCKMNIKLLDHMNEVRKSQRRINKKISDLENVLSDFELEVK